jgi:hypothetical protein
MSVLQSVIIAYIVGAITGPAIMKLVELSLANLIDKND